MIGLRESQKERRREAILVAALSLFGRQGFSATTVEEIAIDAGVSAPTVFNYFGNKQEILMGLVERADRQGGGDLWNEVDNYDNAVDALCRVYMTIAQRELEALPIIIWRELLNSAFNTSGSRELVALNDKLTREAAALLQRLQSRGFLNPDLDTTFVAGMLNDYSALIFARLVQSDEPDFITHEVYVRRICEVIVTGLRP